MTNSWRGKFHLEMHWWHAAHFAQWRRPALLERSLGWYLTIRDRARATARRQGFAGARWPKQVGPEGAETPSDIGPFLVWQQPHPIHLAELVYRARPTRATLERYADLVFDTAAFMTSYAAAGPDGYHLGPPIIPAQESYADDRARLADPTFELAYWAWALGIAGQWRERLGLPVESHWRGVADEMARPTICDGRYVALGTPPHLVRTDHPSMLAGLGVVPPTAIVDPEIMRATLHDVLADWDWPSTWGWDYPMIAMTATRLGEPDTAVDALLMDTAKNTYLINGHNRQTDALPIYLPGNGGLLAAVGLMAAGWDDCPTPHPGFGAGWSPRWEDIVPMPGTQLP